ncbi:reverse transcriptase [Plakobranchus ocellatus]|uniref:Reverse transcriptase n=1 Tax=Plakobranchus ocellatus TaxID=259542 RepID=A0AAV4CWB4_9GAST|nr:reverse transcriptase [Plakobranchus ocellatus]
MKKTQENFFKDPFQCARQLFQGTLTAQKEELETHLYKIYSDPEREKRLEDIAISLLKVEGKIFFSIMASRLTKHLIENGYIHISVQKGVRAVLNTPQ